MTIGQLVEIPIRNEGKPVIAQVERGVVLGFKHRLALVRWRDGFVGAYDKDQVAPVGTYQAGQRWPIRDRVTKEAA